jgi:DNA repair photolyase
VLLRLPHELRALFTEWLQAHYPERAAHVLSLIRQTRGGALNDPRFGSRFSGVGVYADMLAKRFAIAARRFGLDEPMAGLDCSHFAPPRPQTQAEQRQLALL